MAKINWNVTVLPTAEIIGVCAECREEVARVPYTGYHDHNYKLAKLKKQIPECPKCKAVFFENANKPKWEKTRAGYLAKCKNGDFLIFRWGKSLKWRYRTYGNQYADCIAYARSVSEAKKACERHKEFKGAV